MEKLQDRGDFIIDKETRLLVTKDRKHYEVFDDGTLHLYTNPIQVLNHIRLHYGQQEAIRYMDWFKL